MSSLKDFISTHVVFRFDEAAAALPHSSKESLAAGLNYHVAQKHIRRLRRGLYVRHQKDSIDPWLIGSRLTTDGVIAYFSALEFHHDADGYGCQLLTRERFTDFTYNEIHYRAIRLKPRSANELTRGSRFKDGIVEAEREGLTLRVCTRERAYADCCDRLDLIFEGLETLTEWFVEERGLDAEQLVDHALANRSRIAAARLGLLMLAHDRLAREHDQIARLQAYAPKGPTLFDPDPEKQENNHNLPEWNAIIPEWFRQIHYNLRRPSEKRW